MTWCRNPLVAGRTRSVLQTNSKAIPPFIHSVSQTIHMKKVLTAKLYDRLLAQTLDVAYDTEGICVFSKREVFSSCYTVFMQTRRMTLFSMIAIACMTTFKKLRTAFSCLVSTLTLRTMIHFSVPNDSLAKPAFLCFLVFFVLGAGFP